MLKISKEQAEFIREHAKEARITTVGHNKKSRRKVRYVDESDETKWLLDEYERIYMGLN